MYHIEDRLDGEVRSHVLRQELVWFSIRPSTFKETDPFVQKTRSYSWALLPNHMMRGVM